MLDRERVSQYLEGLDRLLRDWEELARESSRARLESDRAFSQRVCYVLLASIQTALDLANLAIAEKGLPRPNSYREAFEILEREGLVRGGRTGQKLRELAGFRNRLVHHYVRLDWAKVQRNLRQGLEALLQLRRAASRWAR